MTYVVTILLIVGLLYIAFTFGYERYLGFEYSGRLNPAGTIFLGLALLALAVLFALGWGLWALFI